MKRATKTILLDAPVSRNWIRIALKLKDDFALQPTLWIGVFTDTENNTPFENCQFCDPRDAQTLSNKSLSVNVSESQEANRLAIKIFESLGKDEYVTFQFILNRQDGGSNFGFLERDRLLKKQLAYWSRVYLDHQFSAFIASNAPHLGYSYAAYIVAKHLGVPTIFLNPTPFKELQYLKTGIDEPSILTKSVGSLDNTVRKEAVNAAFAKRNHEGSEPYYMELQRASLKDRRRRFYRSPWYSGAKRLAKAISRYGAGNRSIKTSKWHSVKADGPIYRQSGRAGFYASVKQKIHSKRLHRAFMRDLSACSVKESINLDEPYVFLPLHYQPELTSSPLGGPYADQIYLAENLRSQMPPEWKLVIKEHWSQTSPIMWGFQGRFVGYYQQLVELPNTFFLDPTFGGRRFSKNASAVATITGTAGWEGLTMGIPCILFGAAWYEDCPGVTRVNNSEDLDNVWEAGDIRQTVDVSLVEAWFEDFLGRCVRLDSKGESASDEEVRLVSDALVAVLTSITN